MRYVSGEKIKEEISSNLKTIMIIHNHKNEKECVVYCDDCIFMHGFKMDYTLDNMEIIREKHNGLIFEFNDLERFHAIDKALATIDNEGVYRAYDDFGEHWVIDELVYLQLIGEVEPPAWKKSYIDWLNSKRI